MVKYDKATSACFLEALAAGTLPFMVVENDRSYQAGDVLVFRAPGMQGVRPKAPQERRVTYVLSGWGVQEGMVALGLAPTDQAGA